MLSKLRGRIARILWKGRDSSRRKPFSSSGDYWRTRYSGGGNSGPGSYNHLAEFKASVLNDLVESEAFRDVIEFGCGDGNQLAYARYPRYTGYDISPDALDLCRNRFRGDSSREFFLMSDYDGRQAALAISLDVIFHLIEDDVFEAYMATLFGAARRCVVIYSSNEDSPPDRPVPHVRHRNFTRWVATNCPGWTLVRVVPNRYPYNGDHQSTSFASFHVFVPRGVAGGTTR